MPIEPLCEAGRTFENWNGSSKSTPACYVEPTDAEEVRIVVQGPATKFPAPVRAAGHWHSLNDCIVADGGTHVSTARLTGITIDQPNATVTVGAGVSMLEIARALLPHGLQLPVMPEIGNATAGSVACCGTKDSSLGRGPGQVSSAVVGLTIVTPRGIETVTEKSDPSRLALLRCSYGLLGIVTEVTFRTEPAQVLKFKYETIEMEPLPSLDRVRDGADGFLAFLQPYSGRMIVERRTIDQQSPGLTTFDEAQCKWRSHVWEHGGSLIASLVKTPGTRTRLLTFPVTRALMGHFGVTLDKLIELGLAHLEFRARRHDTMIEFETGRGDYFDFDFCAFPATRWSTIVPRYLEFCERFTGDHGDFQPSLPTEIYYIAEDKSSPLSVSFDGDVFTLDMVHHRVQGHPFDPRWLEMTDAFNHFAAANGGRPLLNQTKRLTGAAMKQFLANTPALANGWQRLQSAADPRFMSPYFSQLLEQK